MANSSNKNFTIIEIGNDTTKMIVGSYCDPFPYIYCVREYPSRNVMDNGYVKSEATAEVASAIKEVLNVQDETIATKSSMQRVYVILPPNGFHVFRTQEVSAVMGRSNNDGRIDNEDIRQLFKNIFTRTKQNYTEFTQVEVLPTLYRYGQRTSVTPPLGEVADQIGVEAFAHVVPNTLESNHRRVYELAEANPNGCGVSSFGAYSLISHEKKGLDNYFILDLGGGSSVVSIVGQSHLLNSETLNVGMNSLTKAIAEKFKIDFLKAEELKKIYGYSDRKTLFDAPIVINEAGESFYQGNLNQVIESWFMNFNLKLSSCINEAIRHHNKAVAANHANDVATILDKCPILLIGGGANLLGIEKLLEKAIGQHKLEKFIPSIAGVRDPKYVNLVGYLLARCTSDFQYGREDEPRVLTRSVN